VLHDTIEDTGLTYGELQAQFGTDVADLVAEVTDDESLPKVERKRRQVDYANKKSARAKIPAAILETEMNSNIGGLQRLIWALESEFLKEAMKVMSGTRVFAESIGDMQSNMLTEKMMIGARLTLDKRGAK
jgi:GTP diphosphokinase / guanosine-3',5'-bis(diphosphate) 3'-diphosphatase